MNPLLIALVFIEAINAGDAERLSELTTDDHLFIDSDGSEVRGREKMQNGWKAYFSMVPDYRIDVEDTFVRENQVVVLGKASGTFVEKGKLEPYNSWQVPAAWRITIEENKVLLFQVYVNPGPMIQILERLGRIP